MILCFANNVRGKVNARTNFNLSQHKQMLMTSGKGLHVVSPLL